MTTIRHLLLTVGLLLAWAVSVSAQTALNATTVTEPVTVTDTVIIVASNSTIAANDVAVVDREAMIVRSINGTQITVSRGAYGTRAVAHADNTRVYTGVKERFYQSVPPQGSCTRTSERFLPRVVLPSGDVWDCPVGAQQWTLLNSPTTFTVRSEAFNLDNGSGTTIDALLIRPPRTMVITACRIVYEDATTGTVAGGSAKVGTTVNGAEVVAATNYENTKAVGTTTAMTIVDGFIPAGTPVLVRHTGVAATQAGEAVVECDGHYR